MKRLLLLGGIGTFAGLAACVAADMPEPSEGARIYAENCTLCHGTNADGAGSLANNLDPAPANLTTISARNGGVFPRAHVLSVIDGYTRSQPAGINMPEFGLLLEGDTVPIDAGDGVLSPTPRPLAALLAYLESIQS